MQAFPTTIGAAGGIGWARQRTGMPVSVQARPHSFIPSRLVPHAAKDPGSRHADRRHRRRQAAPDPPDAGLPVRPWPPAAGRPARRGQDHAGPHAGPLAGAGLQTHPVHQRPAAGGHHRLQRLPASGTAFFVHARPGLHADAAGRRDQPRLAQVAKCAAGGHGRASGLGGGRGSSPARTVLRDRHPEPAGPDWHLPAARIAAGPLPDVRGAGLPRSQVGTRHSGRPGPSGLADRAEADPHAGRAAADPESRHRGEDLRPPDRLRAEPAHPVAALVDVCRGAEPPGRSGTAARRPRLGAAGRSQPRAARRRAGRAAAGGRTSPEAGARRRHQPPRPRRAGGRAAEGGGHSLT